jgi:Rha family phage regulatory protein
MHVSCERIPKISSHQEIIMSHIKNIKLIMVNELPATTSREIAIHFNKRHKNVLQSIENLNCSPQFTELNFQPSDYKDSSGKTCKEYIVFRDGFIFLTMGFTGELAGDYKEAYIYSFNRMEKELQNPYKTLPQRVKPKINDILQSAISLEKIIVEITYTKQGDVINVNKLEQSLDRLTTKEAPTISSTSSWQLIVETFFSEIESSSIPEKMRQNILLSKEMTSTNEQHDCLFFRLSNLMAFFRKTPRGADMIHESTIRTASMLLKQLKGAGVLAFEGKEKEKSIPMNPSVPSDTHVRRVSHLVAIDLVVLERDYGVVMSSNMEIARTLY